MNVINSTGEYILAESIVQRAEAATGDALTRQLMIGHYYADYAFWITVAGYAVAGFVPVFTLLYWFKIVENSVDYSVMNTTRQALFLPTGYREKFEGKSTIDTLFWRGGDLIQAAVVHFGANVLGWGIAEFALFNAGLTVLWVVLAKRVAAGYRRRLEAQHDPAPLATPLAGRMRPPLLPDRPKSGPHAVLPVSLINK